MSTSRKGEEPQTRHFFICCCYFGFGRLAPSGGGQGKSWSGWEGGVRHSCHLLGAGGLEGKRQLTTLGRGQLKWTAMGGHAHRGCHMELGVLQDFTEGEPKEECWEMACALSWASFLPGLSLQGFVPPSYLSSSFLFWAHMNSLLSLCSPGHILMSSCTWAWYLQCYRL
jgi:hypothetical protein